MYTSIVINENDRAKLIEDFAKLTFGTLPNGWVTRAHHVTINMGELDKELNPYLSVGDSIEMIVSGSVIDWREGVIALTVNDIAHSFTWAASENLIHGNTKGIADLSAPISSINDHPHITMFHHIDVRSKHSNYILSMCVADHLEGISGRLIKGEVVVMS